MKPYTAFPNFMFFITLGIFSFPILAMESPEAPRSFWDYFRKRKDFTTCAQVKSLQPDAPESEYRDVATNLKQNNLTVCDCIQYLLWLKKKKAFEELEQQVPGATQKIVERKKIEDLVDEDYYKAQNYSVTCDPDISQEVRTFIKKEYAKNKTARDLRVFIDDDCKSTNAYCAEKMHCENQRCKVINLIGLSKQHFTSLCPSKQRGTIVHEIAHLNHNINCRRAASNQLC